MNYNPLPQEKQKSKFPVTLIMGIFVGLLMPVIGIFMMLEARPELAGIQRFDMEIVKQINVEIITLGMIINAGLFFLFLRFKQEAVSQGILISSVIVLILIFIYRFLL